MITLMLVGCIAALAVSSAQAADDSELPLQNRLRAHIEFLADDLMLGRQPGSDGYNIAANYVSSQFRQMGLLPAGDDGGYLQQVPLRRAYLEPGSAEIAFINASGTNVLRIRVTQDGAELIFEDGIRMHTKDGGIVLCHIRPSHKTNLPGAWRRQHLCRLQGRRRQLYGWHP